MRRFQGPIESELDIPALLDLALEEGVVWVDTETISIKDRTGIGIGLHVGGVDLYFSVLPDIDELLPHVMWILSDPRITKVYFNALFDLRVLKDLAETEGLSDPDFVNIEDVSLMAQVQGYKHSLEELSWDLLGEANPLSIRELLQETGVRGATMLHVDFEKVARKCMWDVRYTRLCWEELHGRLAPGPQDCYNVDLALTSKIIPLESKGLALRPEVLRYEYTTLREEVMRYESIATNMGFSLGSNQQVGYMLALRGTVLPFTRSGKQLMVNEEVLEECKDPLASMVLAYRKANKLLTTYVVPWLESDRAYTHFRLDLATGRLASFDRNLQNIPPKMRRVFESDSGVFSWMDYSQVEMRVFAYLSKDPVMLQAYADGVSIHGITMETLFPGVTDKNSSQYLASKTFNFAMIYYALPGTLAKRTKLPYRLCEDYRNKWLTKYAGGYHYMLQQMAVTDEYVVSDFGRRMRLPDLEYATQGHIDKCKINYAVQGTAADIIKRAMLKIVDDTDLRLQVHDELVVDGEYTFPEILQTIHPELLTPFESHQDRTWL